MYATSLDRTAHNTAVDVCHFDIKQTLNRTLDVGFTGMQSSFEQIRVVIFAQVTAFFGDDGFFQYGKTVHAEASCAADLSLSRVMITCNAATLIIKLSWATMCKALISRGSMTAVR